MIIPLVGKAVEFLLEAGIKEGAKWALPGLQRILSQKVTEFLTMLTAGLMAQQVEEFLRETVPDLDEIPGEVLQKVGESRLANIGKNALERLSADARRKIQAAGYSSLQIGTALILYVMPFRGRGSSGWKG